MTKIITCVPFSTFSGNVFLRRFSTCRKIAFYILLKIGLRFFPFYPFSHLNKSQKYFAAHVAQMHAGHAGGHFGARARVWARAWAFWCSGAHLGTRAGHFGVRARVWALGRTFWLARGHFGAQARVWARARAFWCSGAHLGTRAGNLAQFGAREHI